MKQRFTLTVTGGLLSEEQREVLLQLIPDANITQRKNYSEYYHEIFEKDVNLSFEDIDNIREYFEVEWYPNFDLVLDV